MFSVRSEKKESVNSREKIVLEADNKFAFKINKLFLVLISCLIVFLFLIAGELTLRFIHRVKNVDRLYFSTFSSLEEQDFVTKQYENIKYSYKPFLLWASDPNQDNGVVSTNSLGYRGNDWGEKQAGTFRIIILGGSSVWGQGATADDKTIIGYLEKELNNKLAEKKINLVANKIEVLNLGQPGYVSTQELLMWKEISAYQPDLVIHYGGFNDLYAGFIYKVGSNLPGINENALTKKKLGAAWSLIEEEVKNRLNKSELLGFFRYHLQKSNLNKAENILEQGNVAIDSAKKYEESVDYINAIASKTKTPVLFVFQPTIFWGNKSFSTEEIRIKERFVGVFPGAEKYFSSAYDYLLKSKLFLDKTIIDGTDFYNEFSEDIYIDHIHTSDKGYEIVAKKLTPMVIKAIEKL
ncbi:MAG: hypothetical protein COU63_04980 [Candidatus Pacebacteria bacterium CG10_big_fil_rev_8_21_14_0_10_36_11]|nr:SGNH/GDSL hydrolase family protein [Candidatus Pacearchaeota archaeon]OIP73825.1 MAG: hypothetical protein AUK08_04690 [Candidatus Pacebacteria bacterium CG2_30_36_39]PIR64291.1 MAG: hypothetical protein COU63_04980 [Candidatus Pacebacteria bacterium CG10_big_fil_rev_8_21_14_0_10_36_11]